MLQAVKGGFLSNKMRLVDADQDVGELRVRWFKDDAEAEVDGDTFELFRERAFSGRFMMVRGEDVIAEAVKPSFLRNSFEVTFGNTECVLRKKRSFRSQFILEHNGAVVGHVRKKGFLKEVVSAEFPDGWPRALQVFFLWLALIIWRREEAAVAG